MSKWEREENDDWVDTERERDWRTNRLSWSWLRHSRRLITIRRMFFLPAMYCNQTERYELDQCFECGVLLRGILLMIALYARCLICLMDFNSLSSFDQRTFVRRSVKYVTMFSGERISSSSLLRTLEGEEKHFINRRMIMITRQTLRLNVRIVFERSDESIHCS